VLFAQKASNGYALLALTIFTAGKFPSEQFMFH
jgi:hypothetical protein